MRRYRLAIGQGSVCDDDLKNRRIEVIAEVKAQWTDRRMVAQAQAYCLREVVKIAKSGGIRARVACDHGLKFFIQNLAGPTVGLFDTDETGPDVGRVIENVAHVVEQHKAQRIVEVRQLGIRRAKLGAVHEGSCAADGKAGERVAWAGGVDGKAAQRLGPACVQALRQRDVPVLVLAKGPFISKARDARQHILAMVEGIVA